jgi:hypothetical protein
VTARRYAPRLAVAIALCAAGAAGAGPYTEGGYAPNLMAAWASAVAASARGPLDIANPGAGNASFGAPENALGAAANDVYGVFSLGDGGSLTLFVAARIGDGPGDDFAVFENGFAAPGGLYAEFAFVEVSSNGLDFARFPAACLHAELVGGGEAIDVSDYHNLAGKHPLNQGTGFDLAELVQHPLVLAGKLDLAQVSYVRLVDVIGDGSTFDAQGRPVHDPYPTPFPSGGFDADAVGVLHLPEPDSRALLVAGSLALWVLPRRRGSCAQPR